MPAQAGCQPRTGRVFYFMQTSFEFPSDYLTKVFLNVSGGITITQESMLGEEDSTILIGSKKRAMALAKAIRDLASAATWESEEEGE